MSTEPLSPSASERPALTIYTKPDCMACEMTQRQLTKAGVEYAVIDLSQCPDIVDQLRAEGLLSAPVVETPDGQRTAGFRPDRIRAIVAMTQAPSPTGARPAEPAPPSRPEQGLEQHRGMTR